MRLSQPYIDKIKRLLTQKKENVVKKQYADMILVNEDGKVLFMLRSNMDDFCPGQWSLPGGSVEENEQPVFAAIRELEEETNIHVDIENVTFYKTLDKDDCKIHYFISSIDSDELDLLVADAWEHQGYEWLTPQEAIEKDLLLDLKDFIIEAFDINTNLEKQNNLETTLNTFSERIENAITVVEDAFNKGEIDEDIYFDKIFKAKQILENYNNKIEQREKNGVKFVIKNIEKAEKYDDLNQELTDRYNNYTKNSYLFNGKLYDESGIGIPITAEEIKNLQQQGNIFEITDNILEEIKTSSSPTFNEIPRAKFESIFYNVKKYNELYETFEQELINQFDSTQNNLVQIRKEIRKIIKESLNDIPLLIQSIRQYINKDIDPLLNIWYTEDKQTFKKNIFLSELEEYVNENPISINLVNCEVVGLNGYSDGEFDIKYFDPSDKKNILSIHNKVVDKITLRKSLEDAIINFDGDLISDDEYLEVFIKAKRKELVEVNRGGKKFYQLRTVGSDKIDDNLDVGDYIFDSKTNLEIKRYSDKAFLISGNYTPNNYTLLKRIKTELGVGSWNPTLKGWVFPYSMKNAIFSILSKEIKTDTYDDNIEKENSISIKNSLNVGSTIIDNKVEHTVTSISSTNGTVEYEIKEKEVTNKEEEKRGRKSVPVGTISKDGKFIRTESGWEYIKKKKKESSLGIPEQKDEKRIDELINNANPENRFEIGKELFGKAENEEPVSKQIDNNIPFIVEKVNVTTRSGLVLEGCDNYIGYPQKNIQIVNQSEVLSGERPSWCPEIDEKLLIKTQYTFDYVKLDDDRLLLATSGYKTEIDVDNYYSSSNPSKSNSYAIVTVDQLVSIQDYYIKLAKAKEEEKKRKYIEESLNKLRNADDSFLEKYRVFSYDRLSAVQKKKYSKEEWENLSKDEKINQIPYMKSPLYSYKSKRVSILKDDVMMTSNFRMYKAFVDKDYKIPIRSYKADDPAAVEYKEIRDILKWKSVDLKLQREENDNSYSKGLETSWGDSGTQDHLLDSLGVKIKSQNGKGITPDQINDIDNALRSVYNSFGDRSSLARKSKLKISHSGEKLMFASKALGIYVPSMNAIGVSNNSQHDKFGFTLAHEFAHFIDNKLGLQNGRNYASDDYNSLAGKIATTFRQNMNMPPKSDYFGRTCECFARALEQYHATKENADEIKDKSIGLPYHKHDEHVSKEKFETIIKPMIDKFFKENDDLLKSFINFDINKPDKNKHEIINKGDAISDEITLKGCLMFYPKINVEKWCDKIKLLVPEDIVIEYETDPHITILYGFDDVFMSKRQIRKKFCNFVSKFVKENSFDIELLPTSYFSNEKDVLKIGVKDKNGNLNRLHELIRFNFKNEVSFDYNPHITIAYLNKGEAVKYNNQHVDLDDFGFITLNTGDFLYSNSNKQKTLIASTLEDSTFFERDFENTSV